jgi:hypothetical protein
MKAALTVLLIGVVVLTFSLLVVQQKIGTTSVQGATSLYQQIQVCWNNPGCPTVPPVTPVGPNLLDPKNCPVGSYPVLDEGSPTFGIAHCEEDPN